MKRLRSSFLVRYIDYGNSEEITELRSTTQPLLQIMSYVVCCTKPDSLSFEKFQKAFENTVSLVVKSVKKSVIELSFTYESHPFILQCFPWDYEISSGHSQLIQNSPVAQSLVNKAGGNAPGGKRVFKDSIDEKKLTVGSRHNVDISFVKNGNVLEVYVQFTEDKKRIASLCLEINQHCSTDTCSKYSPSKDEIVCCLFAADNNWYRAQVLAKAGENKYKVLFIDFGNEDIVSDANMKPLPQKFVCKKLSACVSLFNVKTEDISNIAIIKLLEESCVKQESWVMEVKDASACAKVMFFQGQKSLLELINVKTRFLKSSLNYRKLSPNSVSEVVICFADTEKLYFQKVEDSKAIADLQAKINSGHNKELTCKPEINNVYSCLYEEQWYRACVQSEVSPNTFHVNFIDYGNDANVLTKDFKEISDELFALPVYCIPVITDSEHSELLPETPYSVQVIEEKAGIQKVKFLNLSEDSQLNVFLSSFEKLTLKNGVNEVVFYHSEDGVHYCQLRENIEKYHAMSVKLQNSELKPLINPPKVSEVICAKSRDGLWYRASVEGVHTSNYTVFFIDFGNLEVVATENIKVLPIDFHKYPIFSIPVRIKNATEVKIDMSSISLLKPDGFASDGSQFVEIILSKKTQLPNISSLKNTLLPIDKEVEVALCHLENNVCYFHMTSSQKLIQSIESELINAATFGDLSDLPNEGDVICAKFTDGIWYRGSVKNVCNDQKKSCQIFFIDYGNSEAIELKDLKMLPTKLCEIPILALPTEVVNFEELKNQLLASVAVFKIKFIRKSSDNIPVVELVIPKKDIVSSSLETLVLSESPTEVSITYKEGEIFYVQKESDKECVTDMMKNLQEDSSVKPIVSPEVGQLVCVKFTDGYLYRGLIKEKSGSNAKVFFVDYGNTVTVTEIFMLPSKYSSFPMFSIPVIIRDEESTTSPLKIESVCKVKYTGKMTNGVQVVRICPPINHLLLSSIKIPSLERGSSDVFFHTSNGQFYFVSKATDITKLNEMKSMLASFTGNEIYHVPSVEEVLLVKFEELWYRGSVMKIDGTNKNCEVHLIDLGSTKTIPFSDMSYVPKNITSFPVFLIKVSLSPEHPLKTPISFGKCYTITVVENSSDVPIIKVLQPLMFTCIKRKSLPVNEARIVFFCHKENDVMFLQDSNDGVQIAEVFASAKQCALSKVISHNPIVGELLCAQSIDGGCYRCCIEEVVDADKYKVLYIDYGNSEVVSKKDLRYLSDNLSVYPAFGIAVKIIGQFQVELEKKYSVMAVGEPVKNIQFVKLLLEEKVRNEPAVEIMSEVIIVFLKICLVGSEYILCIVVKLD